jgi:ABC-2 type transport system permease protein
MSAVLFAGTARLWRTAAIWWPVGWAIYAGAVGWLIVAIGQQVDLQSLLAQYPQTILQAFGIESASGVLDRRLLSIYYLAAEVFGAAPIVAAIFAMFVAPGLIGREVERGTMDTLLARPITRRTFVWTRFAFFALVCVALGAATFVASAAVIGFAGGYAPPWGALAITSLLFALDALAFGSIGLAVAAWRLSSGAGTVAVALALAVMFGVNVGRTATSALDIPSKLDLYTWWHPVDMLVRERYEAGGFLLALGIIAVFAVLAAEIFHRRDLV